MRFKTLKKFNGLSLREQKVMEIMGYFGRYDANLKQVWYQYKNTYSEARPITKNELQDTLNRLEKKGLIDFKIYTSDVKHYVMNKDYI